MGSTFNFGSVSSTLNTGSYNDGVTTVTGGTSSRVRNASSTNLTRVSRDLAAGYSQQMQLVQQYLANGDISQAMALYEQMSEDAKITAQNYGYSLTDSQISSAIDSAYSNQTGETFTGAVANSGKSSFAAGILQGIPLVGLFANSYSSAEALSEVSGTETSWKEKAKEYGGSILSGAAAGFALSGFNPVGAVVGGVVGLGQNLIKSIIG